MQQYIAIRKLWRCMRWRHWWWDLLSLGCALKILHWLWQSLSFWREVLKIFSFNMVIISPHGTSRASWETKILINDTSSQQSLRGLWSIIFRHLLPPSLSNIDVPSHSQPPAKKTHHWPPNHPVSLCSPWESINRQFPYPKSVGLAYSLPYHKLIDISNQSPNPNSPRHPDPSSINPPFFLARTQAGKCKFYIILNFL